MSIYDLTDLIVTFGPMLAYILWAERSERESMLFRLRNKIPEPSTASKRRDKVITVIISIVLVAAGSSIVLLSGGPHSHP